MAKITVINCDNCGAVIEDDKHMATMKATFSDKAAMKVADFCWSCYDKLPGRPRKVPGRKVA